MMKRKVSVIWVVVLALIAVAACAFAAVTYYRCEKQPESQFPENELLRILDAGSDAEGVGFEVVRIGGGSVNLRHDLRWKNDSGKTIAYYAEIQSTENFCGFPPRAAPEPIRRIFSRLRWFYKDTTKSWRQSLPPAKALQHYNYISYLHDSQWFLRQMGPFRSDA